MGAVWSLIQIVKQVPDISHVSCLRSPKKSPETFTSSISSYSEFRDAFEIITAVIAGDKSLELRVLSPAEITVSEEQRLTTRLCKLMDRYQRKWAG